MRQTEGPEFQQDANSRVPFEQFGATAQHLQFIPLGINFEKIDLVIAKHIVERDGFNLDKLIPFFGVAHDPVIP